MSNQHTPWPERFWAKVAKGSDANACWLWIGARTGNGYGEVKRGGRKLRAHRVAFELVKGPIPEGLTLDHICVVRLCVNPSHIQAVPNAVNVRLAYLRRFGRRQYRYHGARLEKTSCTNGHPFTPENTYVWPDGRRRRCRTCHMLEHRRARARQVAGRVA